MNITVYCGANLGTHPTHQQDTVRLGNWLADNNHTLIYGGGGSGLMGLLADTVLAAGGQAIGIMPTFLQAREAAHQRLTEMIDVDTMTERKLLLFERGEAYIALPGGLGTLEEISEVISWARIGKNSNPCIFFNSDDFFRPLIQFLDDMVKHGFLSQADRDKTLFSSDFTEIEQFIASYTPPTIRTY